MYFPYEASSDLSHSLQLSGEKVDEYTRPSYQNETVFVPTFDTKVTEYLCSGWVFFFFRQISTF